MKMKNSLKGVTLIELLVVMAIIAILSLIAYANLSGAREEAQKASLKMSMQGLVPTAEVYYLQNKFSYVKSSTENFCTSNDIAAINKVCNDLFGVDNCADCAKSTTPGASGCVAQKNCWSLNCQIGRQGVNIILQFSCGNLGCCEDTDCSAFLCGTTLIEEEEEG